MEGQKGRTEIVLTLSNSDKFDLRAPSGRPKGKQNLN